MWSPILSTAGGHPLLQLLSHAERVQSEAQDGVLSNEELNDFQVHCFALPLQPEELAGVKAMCCMWQMRMLATSLESCSCHAE